MAARSSACQQDDSYRLRQGRVERVVLTCGACSRRHDNLLLPPRADAESGWPALPPLALNPPKVPETCSQCQNLFRIFSQHNRRKLASCKIELC